MKSEKVWLIAGAQYGLGPAAVKYLLAKGQYVGAIVTVIDSAAIFQHISSDHFELIYHNIPEQLRSFTHRHGMADILINNNDYSLSASLLEYAPKQMDEVALTRIYSTLSFIRTLMPFVKASAEGHIINVPPLLQPDESCNSETEDCLCSALTLFSQHLKRELDRLNIRLTVLDI
jgi:NADP-dependent 3-hydroxy acid dehydrogenase YdfG